MPRFVLLRHETPVDSPRASHWDLMFEASGALRTWAIEQLPLNGAAIVAEQLPDHRVVYLDYEGPISGSRGEVRREDTGTFELLEQTTLRFAARMTGKKLHGVATLQAQPDGKWSLLFEALPHSTP